ncbi:Dihydrofolate reductase [Parasponia andersonii]|uniref:dihydrofolate reductase n=1 Tax=Parasponia andersonii TaxID=3476 RepID=A0A2P5C1L3_PARAD|nr:Dihydrofolate reductase [Parasponia andersonii]
MSLLPRFRFSFLRLLRPQLQILPKFSQNRFRHFDSVCASPRLFGVLNGALKLRPCSSFSAISGDGDRRRTYRVVVAATRKMGIGKDGKLPWKLPSDLKFFKELTTTTLDPNKKNAVLMGRKTWESIPFEFRPLPGRVNVVLTRSGGVENSIAGKAVVFESLVSALESLAQPPYSQSIEKVFVIGGGQVLREALNAPECDAIHITEIETSIDCDTFIPPIDVTSFKPWYSSQPLVENNIRFRFATYVRVISSTSSCTNRPKFESGEF